MSWDNARLAAAGDNFDFHPCVLWQASNLDCAARRERSREVLGIHRIHCSKVVHIEQEYRAFHDVIQRRPGSSQNRFDVLEHTPGLRSNVAFNEISARRIQWDLSCAED